MQVNNVPVEPLLYTVNEAKRLLSISHTTAYRLMNGGLLEVRKIGTGTRITAESVKRILEQGAELDDRAAA